MPVGVFQLLLSVLQLLRALLFSLQLTDVVHWCFQDSSLVPAHVPMTLREMEGLRLSGRLYVIVTTSLRAALTASHIDIYPKLMKTESICSALEGARGQLLGSAVPPAQGHRAPHSPPGTSPCLLHSLGPAQDQGLLSLPYAVRWQQNLARLFPNNAQLAVCMMPDLSWDIKETTDELVLPWEKDLRPFRSSKRQSSGWHSSQLCYGRTSAYSGALNSG